MSVCRRNWKKRMCVNEDVTENVKVIYNELYESVNVDKMDTMSVVNEMIDVYGIC